MKSVEDLDVFKLAHQLALKTYSTTFREFSLSGHPKPANEGHLKTGQR